MDDTENTLGPEFDAMEPEEIGGRPVRSSAKKLAYAGIGALAVVYDTANEQFDRFVDRGRRVEEEIEERAEEIRRQNVGTRARTQEYVRSAMDALLERFNLPSKGDLDTINMKLNIVSRKLDEIQLDRVRGGEPLTPGPSPTGGEGSESSGP